MNHLYVRPLRVHDEADKAAFVAAVEDSGKSFPANVFTLPSTRVMVAERMEEHGPEIIMYQPQYVSLVMGSFVPLPGSTDTEIASAQHALTAAAYTRAHTEGFAEVLAFTKTDETKDFAMRHGFEETHPGLRLEIR